MDSFDNYLYNSDGTDDGNDHEGSTPTKLQRSSSEKSLDLLPEKFSDNYNEADLKMLAESLAPRVTSLLDSNEAALENLLSTSQRTWEDSYGTDKRKSNNDDGHSSDEEDGIHSELNRLSDAEQLLRDELEMSNIGFDFMSYINGGGDGGHYGVDDGDDSVTHESLLQRSCSESEDDDGVPESSTRTEEHEGQGSNIYDCDSEIQENSVEETTTSATGEQNSDKLKADPPVPTKEIDRNQENEASDKADCLSMKETYTLYDHAQHIGLQFDNADLGYPTCPLLTKADAEAILDVPGFDHNMHSFKDRGIESEEAGSESLSDEADFIHESQTKPVHSKNDEKRKNAIQDILQCTKEYVKPMTSAALARIYTGLGSGRNHINNMKRKRNTIKDGESRDEEDDDEEKRSISIKTSRGVAVGGSNREIVPIRTVAIQIRPDVLVGAVMDAVYTSTVNSLNGDVTKRQGGHLRALIPGQWAKENECEPFRNSAVNTGISQIFGSPMQPTKGVMNGMVFQPPFVIDAQLCTKKKSRFAERILLIRCFSIRENQILDNGAAVCPPSPPHAAIEDMSRASSPDLSDWKKPNSILRESSSLFQKMRTVATLGGNIAFDLGETTEVNGGNDSSFQDESGYVRKILTSPLKLFSPSSQRKKKIKSPRRRRQKAQSVRFSTDSNNIIGEEAAQKLATEKLVSVFTETPSVLDECFDVDPIAALSNADWPYVQSTWRFLTDCLNELDNRDLAYSTLVSCAFGAFPALPTLDVHYCSDMKEICKENMITTLLKSAQELETYAREAEYNCAKLMQILQPMLLTYEEELPQIPEATPLMSYPLDFVPHEVASPPWGQKVVEALNLIAAQASPASGFIGNQPGIPVTTQDPTIEEQMKKLEIETSSSFTCSPKTEFQRSKDAVFMVLSAFQKQEDEELSARLGRKNCQVMDRLAKMQAYKRQAIMTIRGSYGINILATKAANKFHKYAKELYDVNVDSSQQKKITILPASEQVPLLTCRVMFGGSAGVCYLTYHELLLVTQSIPLLGGNRLHLVLLNDIDIVVKSSGKKSRLNPVPSILTVNEKDGGEELFSFRPAVGAHMLKDFVDIIQDIAQESPEAVDFSSTGGLLNILDEKASFAKAALGGKERWSKVDEDV